MPYRLTLPVYIYNIYMTFWQYWKSINLITFTIIILQLIAGERLKWVAKLWGRSESSSFYKWIYAQSMTYKRMLLSLLDNQRHLRCYFFLISLFPCRNTKTFSRDRKNIERCNLQLRNTRHNGGIEPCALKTSKTDN